MPLFRRRPTLPSTGHSGDDQLLGILSKHGPLETPRHWVHYLYTADEASARDAAGVVERAGWQLQHVDPAAQGPGWVVVAERHDAVLDVDAVREARIFFEGVASSVRGGDYDGWEASA
jgi:hypothetical protein